MAYEPPRDLQESEQLLRGAENWEATKRGWVTDFAIWALVAVAVAAAGFAFFGVAAVAGPIVAVVAFVIAVFLWHDRK